MPSRVRFTEAEALRIGDALNVDWSRVRLSEFRAGLEAETGQDTHDPDADVTRDDPLLTGRIALAHLNEAADYYSRRAHR